MRTTTNQFLGFFLIISIISFISCKKPDLVTQPKIVNTNSIEEKFFNTHRTSDPIEKALVDFIKNANNKEKFIEKTATQIGYPRWDKVIAKSKNKATANQKESLDSSFQTFYIPFVRDSQNYVNASMIIQTSPSDSSFTYRCDWEYAQMQNNITILSDSAEYFAIFFMALDNAVFGYKNFKIVDTNLFRQGNQQPLYIKLDSSTAGGRNNIYELYEFCQDVIVFYTNCTYQGTEECTPTCDQCWRCTESFAYTYCWEEYIETGSGGSGGSAGSGGSGGSGGGSSPPNCNEVPIPISGRNDVLAPCGGVGGWIPIPIEDEPQTISILSSTLGLNTFQVDWLHNHQLFREELLEFLLNAQSSINPSTKLPYFPNDNPEAIMAAKSALQAVMDGIIETGFNQTHFTNLVSTLESPYNLTAYDPMFAFYFSMECINLKFEHPEWSNARVFMEATLEIVHIIFDVAGMIPVIGEIADLANGGIYILQGDGVNATLSLYASIPIAGWVATPVKYAKKLIVAVDGSKRTLKWIKEANGIIKFGDRGLLRKVLGLAKGDSRVAHHLIPWEKNNHELVQMAASGGSNSFHLNSQLNGIPLSSIQHSGSHQAYSNLVQQKMDIIRQNLISNGNFNPQTAMAELTNLINNVIRPAIVNNPNIAINQIFF